MKHEALLVPVTMNCLLQACCPTAAHGTTQLDALLAKQVRGRPAAHWLHHEAWRPVLSAAANSQSAAAAAAEVLLAANRQVKQTVAQYDACSDNWVGLTRFAAAPAEHSTVHTINARRASTPPCADE